MSALYQVPDASASHVIHGYSRTARGVARVLGPLVYLLMRDLPLKKVLLWMNIGAFPAQQPAAAPRRTGRFKKFWPGAAAPIPGAGVQAQAPLRSRSRPHASPSPRFPLQVTAWPLLLTTGDIGCTFPDSSHTHWSVPFGGQEQMSNLTFARMAAFNAANALELENILTTPPVSWEDTEELLPP